MSRLESAIIGVVLVGFIALLGVTALASGIWPLWFAVAALAWALMIHLGLT